VGPASLERPSEKPIENLRPQHLIDAMFWQPIPARVPVLFEEATEDNKGYYVLIVARPASSAEPAKTTAAANDAWEIDRRIWVDRKDLNFTRIETYDSDGKAISDIRLYRMGMFGTAKYARQIALSRPVNDYQIQIGITKLTVNEPITADRFELNQPEGPSSSRWAKTPRSRGLDSLHGTAECPSTADTYPDHRDRSCRRSNSRDLVVGLTTGLLTESAKRTEGVGADVMVQPPSASVFMAFSGAPMPIVIGDKLQQLNTCKRSRPCWCSSIL